MSYCVRVLLQEAWRYSVVSNIITNVSSLADEWYSDSGVPSDAPACGFQGEICANNLITKPHIAVISVIVFIVLSFLFSMVLM